jgi:hypothetical protein
MAWGKSHFLHALSLSPPKNVPKPHTPTKPLLIHSKDKNPVAADLMAQIKENSPTNTATIKCM